jgi:hypothetical protein
VAVDRCSQCEGLVEARFRFCPWCAAPRRRKLVEFFFPHKAIESDRGKALRVSRYLGVAGDQRHVRFSVWNEDGVAAAAVSLDENETARLLDFLEEPRRQAPARSRRSRLYTRLLNG